MCEDDLDESYLDNFITRCPKCGTWTSDPDKSFDLVPGMAVAPKSEFVLLEVLCHSCGTVFAVARFASASFIQEFHNGEFGDSKQSLLASYQNILNQVASSTGVQYGSGQGAVCEFKGDFCDVNLDFLDIDANPDFRLKAPVIPMEALALARGTLMAAVNCPTRMFKCMVGLYNFTLSLDQVGEASASYGVHLSISNRFGDVLTNTQLGFARCLFFSQDERRDLYETPSLKLANTEVKHYFIPRTPL